MHHSAIAGALSRTGVDAEARQVRLQSRLCTVDSLEEVL